MGFKRLPVVTKLFKEHTPKIAFRALSKMDRQVEQVEQESYILGGYEENLLVTPSACSASSILAAPNEPEYAIDGDLTEYWYSNTDNPAWWKYDFGAGNEKRIRKCEVQAGTVSGVETVTIHNWELQGSNNDSNWTTLDTQSGITWASGQLRVFEFENDNSYRYYRIFVADNDPSVRSAIASIEMMEGIYELECGDQLLTSDANVFSSAIWPGGDAENAIDSNLANYWYSNIDDPHWWGYDFGSGNEKRIRKYVFTVGGTSGIETVSVHTWDFQGSNDGVNYTTLHSQSGIFWSAYQKREYFITNENDYRYYRIYVADNDPSPRSSIAYIEMMEAIYI